MTSSIPRAVFKAIVGMLVRKGRTKRGEGAWYGARLVPSRISHQIFFTTSTFVQDFNFPHNFNSFSRLQLSCTTNFLFTNSTFLHDFNYLARLQLSCTTSTFFTTVTFFTTQHFNFPARPKYSAVLVDWTPLDLDPPVQIR